MTSATSFRELEVWQESMTLVEEIYALSKSFPRDELFGLTAQLRKAAVSIPSNIGEGARGKRRKVTLNHYDIALRSQGEVDVPLEVPSVLDIATDQTTLDFSSASSASEGCSTASSPPSNLKEPGRGAWSLSDFYEPRTTNHEPRTKP